MTRRALLLATGMACLAGSLAVACMMPVETLPVLLFATLLVAGALLVSFQLVGFMPAITRYLAGMGRKRTAISLVLGTGLLAGALVVPLEAPHGLRFLLLFVTLLLSGAALATVGIVGLYGRD